MTATAGPAVTCRMVTVAYGETVVVPDLDLQVGRGEMVALLGPSGSGKTTILAALAGFMPIVSGEIAIGGRVVAGPGRHEPPERRDVAVVFQGYALWPHLTAVDTVAFPIRRRGAPAGAARREAATILERLGIGALAHRRPAEMSGGEQQRVGLGRALARGAGTYLFDEPTAHLDPALRERLQSEISEQLRRSDGAAIYATHDTAEALAMADRVVLIRDGRIVQQGSPTEVYERPVDLWAGRLTGTVSIIDLRVVGAEGGRARVEVAGTSLVVDIGSSGPVLPGPARALVRPDWVRLGGELPGRIESIAFRGTHTDHELATPAGTVGLRAPGPPSMRPGEPVSWTLQRAWILQGPNEPLPSGRTRL